MTETPSMTGSKTRRDLLILAALALGVNGVVALLVTTPAYVDAFYYFDGGQRLASGGGWQEPYIWNYVAATGSLPVPAFGYWQPLAALLAAAGIKLFGWLMPDFGAAQLMFVLAAAILPLLAYWLALGLGERKHAWLAGLLTVFSGLYVMYWSLPETFTPFAVCAGGALLLAGRGRDRWESGAWLGAGIGAGLAHLTRADGILVIVVILVVALLPVRQTRSEAGHVGPPVGRRALFGLVALAGYLLAMGPWYAHNLAIYGRLQPPGGLRALWLIDYNDLFSYPPDLNPASYFAAGLGPILLSKWQALLANLATVVAVQGLVFLLPLAVVGGWRRWRTAGLFPGVLYGVLLFAAMTVGFSLVGTRGGWLHSGAALVPFIMAAASLGLDDVVRWVARHRSAWRAPQAWRVFSAASVALAAVITGAMVLVRILGVDDLTTVAWNGGKGIYQQVGTALTDAGGPPDARLISNNPPGYYNQTGHGGIPLVNGDEATLLRAADDYGATYLVIDHNVPEGLEDFYWQGPDSGRFERLAQFGSPEAPVYLYRIHPQP